MAFVSSLNTHNKATPNGSPVSGQGISPVK